MRSSSVASILVLDDERSIAELLGEILSLLGHKPTVCVSPAEALELLERQHFDLILSDFRMPGMNGRHFYAAAVAKRPDLASRIIFLTGDVIGEETQRFLRSTGSPHLPKPFELNTVAEVVARLLP